MLMPRLFSVSIALATIVSIYPIALAQNTSDDTDLAGGPSSDWAILSPDGTMLLFVSNAAGDDTLWISGADGTNPRPLLNWLGSAQEDPDWSPDGNRITFASNRGANDLNIWTVAADGTQPIQLTQNVG